MPKAKQLEKETRLLDIAEFTFEAREDTPDKMILEGYAAVYNRETLIGDEEYGFNEIILPGAFDGAYMRDVPLRVNHSDQIPILARTRNRSLRLTPDAKGLFIHAELLSTSDAVDMYKRVQAKLIDKMSFAFTVAEQEIDDSGKILLRRIKKFARIFDVSVVDTPAYKDTELFARSLAAVETARHMRSVDTGRTRKYYYIENLITMYGGRKK